jgi:hypothetical protein
VIAIAFFFVCVRGGGWKPKSNGDMTMPSRLMLRGAYAGKRLSMSEL